MPLPHHFLCEAKEQGLYYNFSSILPLLTITFSLIHSLKIYMYPLHHFNQIKMYKQSSGNKLLEDISLCYF